MSVEIFHKYSLGGILLTSPATAAIYVFFCTAFAVWWCPASIIAYIGDGACRTLVAAAVATVNAVSGLHHHGGRGFCFVINTMGAKIHAGSAFSASKIIDDWIPVFSHFLSLPLNQQILENIKQIANNDNADGADGNKCA